MISSEKQHLRSAKASTGDGSNLQRQTYSRKNRHPRAYAAQLRGDKPLAVGEKLGVRLDGQNVLATRGLELVAVFTSPTAELKSALSASFGEACGTVQAVHSAARIAEITVC